MRGVPSRGLAAEKTSMLHLRGEYSWVTLYPWDASERSGGRLTGRRERIGWERKWEKETRYRQLAGSYIELRFGAYLSASSSNLSPQLSPASSYVHPPSSSVVASSPAYFISDASDNIFGIYRQQPTVLHCRSYVSADTSAKFAIGRW